MPFSLKDPGGGGETLFQIAAVRDGHQHSSGQGGMSFTNMKVRTSKDKVPLPLSPFSCLNVDGRSKDVKVPLTNKYEHKGLHTDYMGR